MVSNTAETYMEGHCITPTKACRRLFSYDIQKKSHAVQGLNIHLPGNYLMQNISQAQEDLVDI